jgi:hypothetical protein
VAEAPVLYLGRPYLAAAAAAAVAATAFATASTSVPSAEYYLALPASLEKNGEPGQRQQRRTIPGPLSHDMVLLTPVDLQTLFVVWHLRLSTFRTLCTRKLLRKNMPDSYDKIFGAEPVCGLSLLLCWLP